MTFDVVFGAFAASMLVIGFFCVRWAVGRDRAARRRLDQASDVPDADAQP